MNHTPLNYALWLLGRHDRSIGEIKEKLSNKKYSEEEIKKAIDFLCQNKFLDDERFAKNFIRNQLSIKPLGKYQLKMKLKNKVVSEDIIKEAMAEISPNRELELAREAAVKYQKSHLAGDQPKAEKYKEKLTRHLISRGFDWEIVKQVISVSSETD